MSEHKQTIKGQATTEQVDSWKKANPEGIYALMGKNKDEIAYFKYPSREEVNCAIAKYEADKVLDMYEELGELTFLGGSKELLTNTQKFLGVKKQLSKIVDGEEATLVNL